MEFLEFRQDIFGDFGVVTASGAEVVPPPLSKSKAKSLTAKLNRVIREETFTPVSAGRRSRTKGHSFEREIAAKLREIFPESRRHLENHKDDARFGTDIVGVEPFRIQCKKLKRYAPITNIEQVDADRVLGEVPVLVTKGDKSECMAVLPFSDFFELLKLAGYDNDFRRNSPKAKNRGPA